MRKEEEVLGDKTNKYFATNQKPNFREEIKIGGELERCTTENYPLSVRNRDLSVTLIDPKPCFNIANIINNCPCESPLSTSMQIETKNITDRTPFFGQTKGLIYFSGHGGDQCSKFPLASPVSVAENKIELDSIIGKEYLSGCVRKIEVR